MAPQRDVDNRNDDAHTRTKMVRKIVHEYANASGGQCQEESAVSRPAAAMRKHATRDRHMCTCMVDGINACV